MRNEAGMEEKRNEWQIIKRKGRRNEGIIAERAERRKNKGKEE